MTPSTNTLRPVTVINANGPAELALQALSKAQGYFEAFGLEVRYNNVSDGSKALAALLRGEGDICLQIGFGPVLPAIERGEPLKILAGANLRAVHVVFTSRPDIRSVRDLEGRTVGIGAPGALTHQLMTAVLLKHGADVSKVRFASIGNSATVFRAIVSGAVDAGLGEIDNYEQQEEFGVHALPDGNLWNELPAFTNQASYATTNSIAGKRDILVKALAASARLYRFVCGPDSRDALLRARATALPAADPKEAQAQWNFYQERKPYAVNLLLDEDRIRYLQELNVAMGLQKEVLPFDRVADMSLASDALGLLG